MLLEMKVFLIGLIYLLGGLFMVVFPPKNFTSVPRCLSARLEHFNLTWSRSKNMKLKPNPERKLSTGNVPNGYKRSGDIDKFIEDLAKRKPENIIVVTLAPNTRMNNTIKVVEMRSDPGVKKKGVLVIGALDPMAWAATTTVLQLALNFLTDPMYNTPYLTDYDWYMIPVGNPDGIDFTLSVRDIPVSPDAEWHLNMRGATSRPAQWHKNLEGEAGSCFGTNIDRNFAFHWQDDATNCSPQACSQRYHGEKPFSTVEACSMRHYLDSLNGSIIIAVHLSAAYDRGQESIVYPWRYAARRPDNWGDLQMMGESAARVGAAASSHRPHYEVYQSSADGASGGSLEDYLKGVAGIELVYVVRPFHRPIPNTTEDVFNDDYMEQAMAITLGLVRAHRKLKRSNTLSFFGKEKQF